MITSRNQIGTCLTEAGIPIDRTAFLKMNEAAQLQVTDDMLSKMMKFITDKYNSLDFSEIEKSAGNIYRFKYYDMLKENVRTLKNIYQSSDDPGAKKYVDVCVAIERVFEILGDHSRDFEVLYKAGNGMVQLLYTSLVAGCLYSVGTLVSNTIRFITVEQDTDCQVMFDEIPGTIRHVHIRNVVSAANSARDIEEFMTRMMKQSEKRVNESVTLSAGIIAALIIGGVFFLIPKIVILIREIIYSIYYSRVRLSEMLALQEQLIRVNIESLEAGRGNKKIIARQRKIADKLEKWKSKIAIKMDTVDSAMKIQRTREDREMNLNHNNNPFDPENTDNSGSIMI